MENVTEMYMFSLEKFVRIKRTVAIQSDHKSKMKSPMVSSVLRMINSAIVKAEIKEKWLHNITRFSNKSFLISLTGTVGAEAVRCEKVLTYSLICAAEPLMCDKFSFLGHRAPVDVYNGRNQEIVSK